MDPAPQAPSPRRRRTPSARRVAVVTACACLAGLATLALGPSVSRVSSFGPPAAKPADIGISSSPASVHAQEAPTATLHLPYLARGVARGARLETVVHWGGPARAVALDGDFAWLGVGVRVLALDLIDPLRPEVLGTTPPLDGLVRDIALDREERQLHVALQAGPPPAELGALVTLDIGDPAVPTVLQRYELPDATAVAAAGEILVVAAERSRLPNAPQSGAALHIFGVGPGDPPRLLTTWELSDANALALHGGYAYTCDRDGSALAIVDLRRPERPRDAGLVLDVPCTALLAREGRLYALLAAAENQPPELVIFDLAAPSEPALLGRLPLLGEAWDDAPWQGGQADVDAAAMALRGHRLWLTGASREGGFLKVVDVQDAAAPRPLSSQPVQSYGLALDIDGQRMALAGALGDVDGAWFEELPVIAPLDPEVLPAAGRFELLDLGRPGRAEPLGRHDTPSAWLLEAAMGPDTGRAYLLELWRLGTTGQVRLWIVDAVADPPRVIGVMDDLPWELVEALEQDRWQRDMVALTGAPAITVAGDTVVVDARRPEEPLLAARVRSGATALAAAGATLLTAGQGSLVPWRLDADQVPLPLAAPISVADTPWLRLAAGNETLWRTASPTSVELHDLRDPSSLEPLGRVELGGQGLVLAASGSRAAALSQGHVWLLEPRSPKVAAEVALPPALEPTAALAIDGRRLWWPALEGGVIGLQLDASGEPAAIVRSQAPAAAVFMDPLDRLSTGDLVSPYHAARVGSTGSRVVTSRYGQGATVLRVMEAVAP